MPSTPSIWSTTLPIITGISGFIGGILSEPLKQMASQWLTKRNLKRLVFAEFAHNLDTLVTIVEGNKGKPIGANIAKKLIELNVSYKNFEFAESQALLFYQIPEAVNIRNIYSGFKIFLEEGPIIIAATTILKRCDDDMLQKHLRIKDFKRYRLLKDLNRHLTSLESRR